MEHLSESNLVVKSKRTALTVFSLAVNTPATNLRTALTCVLTVAGDRDFEMLYRMSRSGCNWFLDGWSLSAYNFDEIRQFSELLSRWVDWTKDSLVLLT